MIGRRPLLAVGLAAGAAAVLPGRSAQAALPVPPGNRMAFNIIREGSVIGQHVLTFQPSDDGLTVQIAVDISVGLGPIKLFRYRHRGSEHWRDGKVFADASKTDDDGTDLMMTAQREGPDWVVSGSKVAQYVAPADASPATHWNKAMLNGPLINTENGRLMRPVVTLAGLETITVGGGPVQAQHYQLRGDVTLDTWYDLTPAWVALRFTAKDGSDIRYQRV